MLAMHLRTVTGRATVAVSTVVRWLFYKVITYIMLSLGVGVVEQLQHFKTFMFHTIVQQNF